MEWFAADWADLAFVALLMVLVALGFALAYWLGYGRGYEVGRGAGWDEAWSHGKRKGLEEGREQAYQEARLSYSREQAACGGGRTVDPSIAETSLQDRATEPTAQPEAPRAASPSFEIGGTVPTGPLPARMSMGTTEPEKEVVDLYNSDAALLRGRYPIETYSVANVNELLENPDASPRLARSETGIYWIVRLDESRSCLLPRPGLVLSTDHVQFGGMSRLFTFSNYRHGYRYRGVSVLAPTRLMGGRDRWQVVERGVLELSGEETEA